MSTTIHDQESHIIPDSVKSITPQLIPRKFSIKPEEFITLQRNAPISKTSSTSSLLTTGRTSVYTTYNDINRNDRSSTFYKYGMKFYRYLIASNQAPRIHLLGVEHVNPDDLIFYLDDGTQKGYTLITDRYKFLIDYLNIPEPERNFFEIITGHQKIHFDIDAKLEDFNGTGNFIQEATNVLYLVINAIQEVLLEYNVNYSREESLLIFDSSGPNKQSYHIVVDNWYHTTNKEAKAFYSLVMNKIDGRYNTDIHVDPAVYSSRQNFRLFGSQKPGSNRCKRLDINLSRKLDATPYTDLDNFYSYFVGITTNCQQLPSFINDANSKKILHTTYVNNDIGASEEEQAILLFSGYPCYSQYVRASANTKGIISYNRVRPGICPCIKHTKQHDSVGCYLTITHTGVVYFNCYSSNPHKQSFKLGRINRDPTIVGATPIINNINNTDDSDLIEADDLSEGIHCKFIGDYCINHGKECDNKHKDTVTIGECTANELDEFPSQITQQHVQATPIIMNIVNNQNILINPSQLVANTTLAAHKSIYNSNSWPGELGKSLVPANRDTLAYFIRYHTTADYKAIITLDEFVETYNRYCTINTLTSPYKTDILRLISRDISLIDSKMKTERKRIKGARPQCIVGYKFHMLQFMNTRLDVQVQRTLDVTHALPMVIPKNIKQIEKKNHVLSRKEWYDAIILERLQGNHTIDMSPELPNIQQIVGDRKNYMLFLKAVCAMGKTGLIREALRGAKSYLIVVGRINLGRKIENDLIYNVEVRQRDGMITTEMRSEAKFYSDMDGEVIRVNYCIVTIDSLYRVEGYFDYMILDECSYTLNQLVKFSKNKGRNVDALIERIQRTNKILVADAFLQQTTVDILTNIREKDDTIIYENQYPKQNTKEINELTSPGIFYSMIGADVASRTKMLIPSGSAITAEAIAKTMVNYGCKLYREDQVPEENETAYKVKIYTGDDRKFGDPTVEWDLYDCVIYTSVLEAGNSFIKRHFDKVYGFFTKHSFGPDSAVQMIFRSRQLVTGKVYVLI